MVELHVILTIFLLSILSFFDFIVFNEEILLAWCFLSFLFYKESRFQASLCLTPGSSKFGQTSSSFSLLRRFYCQGINDWSKWDFTSEALALKCETQSIESLILDDLRPLKREIKTKHKNLVSELKKHSPNIWPMSKHGILIRELVILRQKYLAMLSKLYGYNSKLIFLNYNFALWRA